MLLSAVTMLKYMNSGVVSRLIYFFVWSCAIFWSFEQCLKHNADHISDLRDPGTVPLNFTKSINLALSERGINAMRHSGRPGLLDSIMAETIPMHGRMIHGEQFGKLFEDSQQYDIYGRVSWLPSCPYKDILMCPSASAPQIEAC